MMIENTGREMFRVFFWQDVMKAITVLGIEFIGLCSSWSATSSICVGD